jgi:hypothetical protein
VEGPPHLAFAFAFAVVFVFAFARSSNISRPPKNCVIPTEAAHSFIVSGAVEGPPYLAFVFAFAVAVVFAFAVAFAFAFARSSKISHPPKTASSRPKPLTVSS